MTTSAPSSLVSFAPTIDAPELSHQGPFASLERRLRLSGPTPDAVARRISFFLVLCWLVPLVLAGVEDAIQPRAMHLSFGADLETHARALVAIPLLLFADRSIDGRISVIVRSLVSMNIVGARQVRSFTSTIADVRRLGASPFAEGALAFASYAIVVGWCEQHAGLDSWTFVEKNGRVAPTIAGLWHIAVAVPLYVFLVLRWVWRWGLLTVLFYRTAKLPLHLVATHSDRAGGIAFLSEAPIAFAWVIASVASVASAKWLDAILYGGASARSFIDNIEVMVVVLVIIAFLPLTVFAPRMVRVRMRALRRYSGVVTQHAREVAHHWLVDRATVGDEASSLCDLNSVFGAIRDMRFVPIRLSALLFVAAAALVPTLPVIVQIIPLRQLLETLGRSIF